jgi:hypothetical protein
MDYERFGIISTIVITIFLISIIAILSQEIEFTAKKDISGYIIPNITSSTNTDLKQYCDVIPTLCR